MVQRLLPHSRRDLLERKRTLLVKPLLALPEEFVSFLLIISCAGLSLRRGRLLRRRSVRFLLAFRRLFRRAFLLRTFLFCAAARFRRATSLWLRTRCFRRSSFGLRHRIRIRPRRGALL